MHCKAADGACSLCCITFTVSEVSADWTCRMICTFCWVLFIYFVENDWYISLGMIYVFCSVWFTCFAGYDSYVLLGMVYMFCWMWFICIVGYNVYVCGVCEYIADNKRWCALKPAKMSSRTPLNGTTYRNNAERAHCGWYRDYYSWGPMINIHLLRCQGSKVRKFTKFPIRSFAQLLPPNKNWPYTNRPKSESNRIGNKPLTGGRYD